MWPYAMPRAVGEDSVNEVAWAADRLPMTPLSAGALQQMIQQNDEKAEEAHKRLREDLSRLDQRFSVLAASQAEMRLSLLKAATPDVTNLRMSPGTVFAIIMFVLSLSGAYLTMRDSIAQLRQQLQMQDVKINELPDKVINSIRQSQRGLNP